MSNQGKPWLIIPVEVQSREMPGKLLLANLAVERGYRVILGKDTTIRRLAPFLPKGVIYDKSLGLARHGKPQRFKRLGHKVVVMDEESTGFYGSPDRFLGVRLSEETLNCSERWFCISNQLREHAIREYPGHASQFVVSGLARTDIWRKAFQPLFQDEVDAIRAEHGRYILFCSNFGGIIHARGEHFVRRQLRTQSKAYAKTEEEFEQIFVQGRKNLDAFIEVLPKIKSWFPGHKLIVRPHPSESVEFWQSSLDGIENCAVVSNTIATPWILGSDCLFHHGCTTGIEAEIMGKSHVMYAPFPDDHHDTRVMEAFAPIVKDENALRALMEELVNGGKTIGRDISAKEEFYSNLSGRLASDLIMDEVDKIALPGKDFPAWFGLVRFSPRMVMADFKLRTKRDRAYSGQKWKGTSVNEIRSISEKIRHVTGAKCALVVSEKIPHLFVLDAN